MEKKVKNRQRYLILVSLVQGIFSTLATLAFLAEIFFPSWIEDLIEFSPDNGSGQVEWEVAATLLLFAVIFLAGSIYAARRSVALV